MWLFLVFVGVPILEIALFIEVGGAIGLWPTLAIVVLTALAGTVLMRAQGLQALGRLQAALERGGDPVGPLAHGALILVAGILLLTPGFFTDAVGLLLLVPAVRSRAIAWGASKVSVQVARRASAARAAAPQGTDAPIDADYDVVEEPPLRRPGGNSGWTRSGR